METIEDKPEINETKTSQLLLIGGHDLSSRKPIFSSDSKFLLIPSGNRLRRYVVESGAFITSNYFGHKSDIISIEISDKKSDEVLITSSDGLVVVWNLVENRKVSETKLNLKKYEQLVWFQLVSNYFYFLIINKNYNKCQLFYCPKNFVDQRLLISNNNSVNPSPNSLAFGPQTDPKFCATISENILYVYEIPVRPSSARKRHLIRDDKQFTCVACHPNEDVIATGDTLGRIILWHNFMDSNFPSRSIMHWHQLPVSDLCFSPEGSSLYSVGSEMTIVRWSITGNHFGHKNVLPRLGMAIKYVTVDSNLHMIAVTHEDNTIKILDPQMKGIRTVIEGLCLGSGKDSTLSTGLLWNNKMRAFLLNGMTGHMQLYSPSKQKQLFQLDVCSLNVVQSNNDRRIFPIEVTKAAVSEDGNWLSTLEFRDDFETLPEIRLKFWRLKNLNNYFLNTTIHLPHQSDVNCLAFAPNSKSMISTGKDSEFKIWDIVSDDDKSWWKCSRVGKLTNTTNITIANWSSDSSLLAVVFDNCITLWDVSEESKLNFYDKISNENTGKSEIIFVEFGNLEKSHYLIEGSNSTITVWNLIEMNVLWTFKTTKLIESIALNRWENKLAVCSGNEISFFKLDSNTPELNIGLKQNNQNIILAVFSNENPNNLNEPENKYFLSQSKFYCMTNKQELFVLNENEKQNIETEVTEWYTEQHLSPIALMLFNKKQKRENLNHSEFDSYFQIDMNCSKLVEEMFFNVPSHVLPPMNVLSKTFLISLLNCHEKDEPKDEKSFVNSSQYHSMLAISYDKQTDTVSTTTDMDMIEKERDVETMIIDVNSDNNHENIVNEDYSWIEELNNF